MFPTTKLRVEMEGLRTAVDKILKELRPNSGTSIKDSLVRIEKRQLISDKRYRASLITNDRGVFEVDAVGDMIWVSPTFCILCGKVPNDLMGRGWVNAVHPDNRGVVIAEWNEAINQGRDLEINFLLNTYPPKRVTLRTARMLHNGAVIGYMGRLHLLEDH